MYVFPAPYHTLAIFSPLETFIIHTLDAVLLTAETKRYYLLLLSLTPK